MVPPHRSGAPRVCAFLAPREQSQLQAATADRLTLVARPTVQKICEDVAAGYADGVIISAAVVREADLARLRTLTQELPTTPIVGLVSDGTAATVAGALLLGQAGITRLIDIRDRTGWGAVRNAFTFELPEDSVRTALTAILNAIELAADGTRLRASDGLRRFFAEIFSSDATTIRRIAAGFGIAGSTFMSRFGRAGLPSPKQYLALAKLVRAAYLGEARGLSIRLIAARLNASSAQSYSRTVRHLTGMSPGEFRRRIHGAAMLERFTETLIRPHVKVLCTFDPLKVKRPLSAVSGSKQAA